VIMMDTRALPACGLINKSGHYTRPQFIERCNVDPLMFPRYFRVNRSGLVIVKDIFRIECDFHFDHAKENWVALGIAC